MVKEVGSTSHAKREFIEKTTRSLPRRILSSLVDFWNEYKRHKMGLVGLSLMLIVIGFALIGPIFVDTDIKMTTRQHARYSKPSWTSAFDPHSFKDQHLIEGLTEETTTYSSSVSSKGLEGDVTWSSSGHSFVIEDKMWDNSTAKVSLTVNRTFTWDHKKPPKALLYSFFIDMDFENIAPDDIAWVNTTSARRASVEIGSFIKFADRNVSETFRHVENRTQLGDVKKGRYGIVLHSRMENSFSVSTRVPGTPSSALQSAVRDALFDKEGRTFQIIQTVTYEVANPRNTPSEEAATFSVTISNTTCISESHYYGLMGTNEYGAGLLPLIIDGAQISLIIGFSVASAQLLIGVSLGLISGYYGGLVDETIQRVVDFLLVMPTLPLWMVLTSIFWEIGLAPILVVWIVLTAFGWVSITKLLRAQVLSEREKPYIEAAEASGVPNPRIMMKHILPNVLPLVMMYVMLGVQGAILGEAALSFLGLGPHWNSWGRILQHAAGPIMGGQASEAGGGGALISAWWYMLFPGIFLAMVGVGFMFIGLTLDAVFNPQRSY